MSEKFMAPADLAYGTGYVQPARQIQYLQAEGIGFSLSELGIPRVTWAQWEKIGEMNRDLRAPKSHLKSNIWVYFIRMETPDGAPLCKVGISNNPHKRFASLKGANPYPLTLVGAFRFGTAENALAVEQRILNLMSDNGLRVPGTEWIRVTASELLQVFAAVRADLKIRSNARMGVSKKTPGIMNLSQSA